MHSFLMGETFKDTALILEKNVTRARCKPYLCMHIISFDSSHAEFQNISTSDCIYLYSLDEYDSYLL